MRTYTANQIKKAFWKTFHKQGEIWFDYLSNEKSNNYSTEIEWNEFIENLMTIQNEESEHERF